MDDAKGATAAAPPAMPLAGRWDSAMLVPVAELNELMLQILRAAAAAPAVPTAGGTACAPPRLVTGLRERWCALNGSAQPRLARCPYLLLDAGFASRERWDRLAMQRGVMDGGAVRGCFAGPSGVALVRRTLVFAWHLARSNRLSARVLLGMSAECAERIADSALKDLEALAELSPPWVAPRWEQQPAVWRQMIRAALDGRPVALRRVQLRGLQLLAAGERGSDRAAEAVRSGL
ncbi:MAG TPA: hypothetical protein VIX87_07710 [Steroidobacteraceae bacterium]